MTSIRARTAALVALSMAALLLVGGIVLLVVLRQALTAQFDEALSARAAALQSLTRFDGTKVELDFAGEAMPGYARDARPEFFLAWVRDSGRWRLLERSESLSADDWPHASVRDGAVGVRDLALPGGEQGRALLIEFPASREHDEEREHAGPSPEAPPTGGQPAPAVRLLVALSRGPLDRTLAILGSYIAGVGAALALAGIAASRWAVSRGLRPLSSLSQRVRALGPDTLHSRFHPADLPAEVRPIAEQLNALLARLQEAFEREKRFSAAASHELRTPIAELRTLLDVAASRPRSSAEWSATCGTAQEVLARAQSLCEALLNLSRAGSRSPAHRDPAARTEVAAVLSEQASRSLTRHGGDPQRLSVECPPGIAARLDPATLGSILGNLIDNALRHGQPTPRTPAIARASASNGRLTIEVINPAAELTPADLDRLFEPFWRKDESRSDQAGFGLGLAVARELARSAGGDLSANLLQPGVLRQTLTLSTADEPGKPA